MGAQAAVSKRRTGAPSFSTYVDVDVDIDAADLERAGWRYVGDGGEPDEQTVLDVVRQWHDDTHDGPWRWCPEQPCDTLRGREADS